MENYILFDDNRGDLLPLTYIRPVADIRLGILTIREKWEKYLSAPTSSLTEEYLSKRFVKIIGDDNFFINGSVLPDSRLVNEILNLPVGAWLIKANTVIAARLTAQKADSFKNCIANAENTAQYDDNLIQLSQPWQVFGFNDKAIRDDFKLLTHGRKSQPISTTNQVLDAQNVFIENGARVECAILNATEGPVYIGQGAEVMEGALIRGPFALCAKSVLKMGSKIYGATTIGPGCKVGGEIQNSVFFANSNKAHDGYLGNAVIAEWCNLGADTNNSNLKNNYSEVKIWNYPLEKFVPTGLRFCGLIMGDHSKCGINTMFNTGTVIGISANIFGSGYPRNFIPSFSWGGAQGLSVYPLAKAVETAQIVMERRNLPLNSEDREILEHIFVLSEKYRR